VSNAIKFTQKGYVRLIIENIKYNRYRFCVIDTGIGISGQNQELVFERFAQEDKELSNKKGGLGLGLSIAKENAELLRGNISLESGKGKGSTFTLSIPYKKAGVKSTDEPKISKQIFTILIAEDEEINYMYLSEILRDRFKTIHAKNGKEAIDLSLKSNNIDLILMDIKMPDMDGHQATRIIKENNPRIPIIAQTAYSSIFDKKLSLQSGCDDFISKPINKDELLDMIDRYLSNTGSVLKN
jgi:CheY-like chemotaxis protein